MTARADQVTEPKKYCLLVKRARARASRASYVRAIVRLVKQLHRCAGSGAGGFVGIPTNHPLSDRGTEIFLRATARAGNILGR